MPGTAAAPAPVPPAPRYSVSVSLLRITNTRALHNDTDYVSVTLTVGTNPPQTKTKKIGDVDNGTHAVGLGFENIELPPGQKAIFSYAVVNNGHASEADVESALEKVGNALGQKAAQAAASVIGGAVGAELGATLGTAAVPIIGTALGALAGWLVGELTGVLFADCDGPVAAGVHVFASEDLIGVTALGAALTGTDYSPGTNSPVGCGSNSDYYVDWSVGAASPPSTAPRPDPIGGGRPLPIGAPTRLQ